jgi:hypothetical protein
VAPSSPITANAARLSCSRLISISDSFVCASNRTAELNSDMTVGNFCQIEFPSLSTLAVIGQPCIDQINHTFEK